MKKLVLKQTTMPGLDGKTPDYGMLIKGILENVNPSVGIAVAEMRTRSAILDELDKAIAAGEGALLLEEKNADKLKALVQAHAWGGYHKEIIQFCDDVENMETVEVVEKKD